VTRESVCSIPVAQLLSFIAGATDKNITGSEVSSNHTINPALKLGRVVQLLPLGGHQLHHHTFATCRPGEYVTLYLLSNLLITCTSKIKLIP